MEGSNTLIKSGNCYGGQHPEHALYSEALRRGLLISMTHVEELSKQEHCPGEEAPDLMHDQEYREAWLQDRVVGPLIIPENVKFELATD